MSHPGPINSPSFDPSPFLRAYYQNGPYRNCQLVGSNASSALFYATTKQGVDEEAKFLLVSNTGRVAEFGSLGMLQRVVDYSPNEQMLVERLGPRGVFQGPMVSRLVDVINEANAAIASMDLKPIEPYGEKIGQLFSWDINRLTAYHHELNALVSDRSILPLPRDDMLYIGVANGCVKRCSFCEMAGSFKALTLPLYEKALQTAREIIEKYHSGFEHVVSRVHADLASALWLPKARRRDDQLIRTDVARLIRANIPYAQHVQTFFDLEQPAKADRAHLAELAGDIQTVLLGTETGHPDVANLFDKPVDFNVKVRSIRALQAATFDEIGSINIFGGIGFSLVTEDGRKVTSREANEMTNRLHQEAIIQGAYSQVVMHQSKFRVYPNKLGRMHESKDRTATPRIEGAEFSSQIAEQEMAASKRDLEGLCRIRPRYEVGLP